MKVYRVYDTLKSEYWKTVKGRTVFMTKGEAEHSWNMFHGYHLNKFNDSIQTRYVIHSFDLIRRLEGVK